MNSRHILRDLLCVISVLENQLGRSPHVTFPPSLAHARVLFPALFFPSPNLETAGNVVLNVFNKVSNPETLHSLSVA